MTAALGSISREKSRISMGLHKLLVRGDEEVSFLMELMPSGDPNASKESDYIILKIIEKDEIEQKVEEVNVVTKAHPLHETDLTKVFRIK